MVIVKLDVPHTLDSFRKINTQFDGVPNLQNLPLDQICLEYKPIERLKQVGENLSCLCNDYKEKIKSIPIVQRLTAPRICSVCELKDTVLKNRFSEEFVNKVNYQADMMDQRKMCTCCQCGDNHSNKLDHRYEHQAQCGPSHRNRSVENEPYSDDLWNRQFQRWWGWNYGKQRNHAQNQWSPQYAPPCRCMSENWHHSDDLYEKYNCYPIQPTCKKQSFWNKICKLCKMSRRKCKKSYSLQDRYHAPHVWSNYECPCQMDMRGRRHHRKADDRVHQSWMHDKMASSLSSNTSRHSCSSIEYLTCRIKAVVDNEDDACSCCCCCPCRVQCQPAICQTEAGFINKPEATQTDQSGKGKRKCCRCCRSYCKNNVNVLCNRRDNVMKPTTDKPNNIKRNSKTKRNEIITDKTKIYRSSSMQHDGHDIDKAKNISTISTIPTPEDVYFSHVKTSPLFLDPIFSSPITGKKYTIAPKTIPDLNHNFSILPKPISVPFSFDYKYDDISFSTNTNKVFKKPSIVAEKSEEILDLNYNDEGHLKNLMKRYSLQNLEGALHKLNNDKCKPESGKDTLEKAEDKFTDPLNGLLQASQIVKNVMASFKNSLEINKPIAHPLHTPISIPATNVETQKVAALQMTRLSPMNIPSSLPDSNHSTNTITTSSLPRINMLLGNINPTTEGSNDETDNADGVQQNVLNMIATDGIDSIDLQSCESSSTCNEITGTYSELTDGFGPLPVIATSKKDRCFNDFFKRKRKQRKPEVNDSNLNASCSKNIV